MAKLQSQLRHFREQQGLTQSQLAYEIGVSRKTINTVENGVFVPSTVIALKLAKVLNQPVEAIFQLAEEPSSED